MKAEVLRADRERTIALMFGTFDATSRLALIEIEEVRDATM